MKSLKLYSSLPGKTIHFSFSAFYLLIFVVIPLGFLLYSFHQIPFKEIAPILSSPKVLHAFKLSFSLSFCAALIDLAVGVIIAWVLVKYTFPGKEIFDAMIDLPFAMPTAISGISLAALYSQEGWFGSHGIAIAYTPLGILVALVFVGLPFVVRALQPAIRALEPEMEEAAECLGASKTLIFRKIILPQLFPSIIAGLRLVFQTQGEGQVT